MIVLPDVWHDLSRPCWRHLRRKIRGGELDCGGIKGLNAKAFFYDETVTSMV